MNNDFFGWHVDGNPSMFILIAILIVTLGIWSIVENNQILLAYIKRIFIEGAERVVIKHDFVRMPTEKDKTIVRENRLSFQKVFVSYLRYVFILLMLLTFIDIPIKNSYFGLNPNLQQLLAYSPAILVFIIVLGKRKYTEYVDTRSPVKSIEGEALLQLYERKNSIDFKLTLGTLTFTQDSTIEKICEYIASGDRVYVEYAPYTRTILFISTATDMASHQKRES